MFPVNESMRKEKISSSQVLETKESEFEKERITCESLRNGEKSRRRVSTPLFALESLHDVFRDLLVLQMIVCEQLVHVVAVVKHLAYTEVEHAHA